MDKHEAGPALDARIESPESLVDALVAKHVTDGDAIPAAVVADAIRKRDAQWDIVHRGLREGASDDEIAAMLDTIGPLEPMTEETKQRLLHKIDAALRIAREGTDEPVKGMQLSDGRKPPPPPVKASRADDDDDLPAGVNPGMGDVSRTLNRLKELMPRVGDTILLIDHFPAAVERMNARQICRTDRRFKMTNAGQTARRVEA